jgi:Flp pilus assembly protein protease CpaA
MRWLVAYIVSLIVTVILLMLFIGYGIGGCDCRLYESLFCWLCAHQLVVLAVVTSPLWVTALTHIHASQRWHGRELYGEDDPRRD